MQAADFSEESKMAAAMGLSRPEKRAAARNNWYSPRGTRAGTGTRMLERGRRDLDEEEFPRNLRSVLRYLIIFLDSTKNSKKSPRRKIQYVLRRSKKDAWAILCPAFSVPEDFYIYLDGRECSDALGGGGGR